MDEFPAIDLSHLLPGAQGLARLPAAERIQRIRADRWFGYPRAVDALNRLETLFAWPSKQRMPNLLLVGPTNNGKSMIIEKFRRTHPATSGDDQEHIPVLCVQMPSEPSVTRFYVALLAAMGAPLRPRQRLPEMEQLALSLLRRVGVRMLVIDELHNVLAGNSVSRLIESQILNATGEFAGLFVQEPQREFTNGLPVHVGSEEPVNYWRKAAEAIEEAVLDARHNPETARSLFRLASYGRNDPASLEQLRAIFAKEQIPAEFLLHYEPAGPFTCHTLSNALSDSF